MTGLLQRLNSKFPMSISTLSNGKSPQGVISEKNSFVLLKTMCGDPYFSFFVFLQRLLVVGHPKTVTHKKQILKSY